MKTSSRQDVSIDSITQDMGDGYRCAVFLLRLTLRCPTMIPHVTIRASMQVPTVSHKYLEMLCWVNATWLTADGRSMKTTLTAWR